MRAYPAEMRERVHALVKAGMSRRKIAQELGISASTIERWLNPDYDARSRIISRRAKEARRRNCRDCGKQIWHTSTRCHACSMKWKRQHRYWTRERIIGAIQEWARANGRQPSASDWKRSSATHPCATAIYGIRDAEFSSWREAIEAAGFTTRRGVGRGNSTWTNEEAQALREQGLTDTEIGKRFGVSSSAIGQRLGPRTPSPVSRKRTREQRIADLRTALAKGEHDGHRDREGDDRDRTGRRAGATPGTRS